MEFDSLEWGGKEGAEPTALKSKKLESFFSRKLKSFFLKGTGAVDWKLNFGYH